MEKDRFDKNIGKKLDGRYEITELIGEGGMADVYRATDVVEHRTVAVKILKKEFAENEEFLRRFRNESKAIAVLSHPNIVKIFDVGFSDRIQFIVMEYIDGITLNEYMEQQGQLGWKDAVHFILQILRALQHAHSKGIVHRDIKPQNIMMLRDGTIKVMDFGIAKFAREDGKTGTDKAIGTVHYISPEQARGGTTDAKSDIYSIGVMLYEMLTGKKPFDTDNPVSIAVMHMQAKVPLPSTIRPDIQIGLEEIILKAMEKDPADRYQSAREMMEDLQAFKEDPDGVFGYYPELFEGEEPMDDMFSEDDASKTRYYRPVTEENDLPPEDEYYDDDPQQYYEEEEQYYDDRQYGDRAYAEAESDEDEEEYEEESKSLFVPILSAVIIVVIVVATVLFTTLIYNMLVNQKAQNASEEFAMPNLVGMDYTEAKLQYGDKLVLNIISSEYSTELRDKIFDQDIKSGDPVTFGETVNVKVSLGQKKVQLPNIEGWDFDTAKSTLINLGLYIDKRNTYSDEVEKDKVISTDPPCNEGLVELEPGSYVQVLVSLGENKQTVPVPNFITMKWEQAKTTADGMKLVLAKKEVDDDTAPEGTVLNQNIAVGEEVSEGTVIELTVSTGKKKDSSVRIQFNIPDGTNGLFRIKLYEGGIIAAEGATFNPEYAAGVTGLNIQGKDRVDYVAYLINDETNQEAKIGDYRVDFDTNTVEMLSGDVEAAFRAVGGLKGAPVVTTPVVTTPPVQTEATQAPVQVETQAPVQVETQAPTETQGWT